VNSPAEASCDGAAGAGDGAPRPLNIPVNSPTGGVCEGCIGSGGTGAGEPLNIRVNSPP
jgi:hypothetical protein